MYHFDVFLFDNVAFWVITSTRVVGSYLSLREQLRKQMQFFQNASIIVFR
jgi:hypothetical protein